MIAILERVVAAGEALAGWAPAKELFQNIVQHVTEHASAIDSLRQSVSEAAAGITSAVSAVRTEVTDLHARSVSLVATVRSDLEGLLDRVRALEAKVPTPAPNDAADTVLVPAQLPSTDAAAPQETPASTWKPSPRY